MKTYGLLIALFSISISQPFAQSSFREGYIVHDGDTLRGSIGYRENSEKHRVCVFEGGNGIRQLTPDDIDGYRLREGRTFVSREIDVDRQGKVSLRCWLKGD